MSRAAKVIVLLVTVYFMTIPISYSSAGDWSLVYINNADGSKVSGNINDLARAIRSGSDVKVSFSAGGMDIFFQCEWAYVKGTGSQSYVVCMNSSHISVRHIENGEFGFQDDAFHAYYLADTKGQVDTSRWLVGEHTSTGQTLENWKLKWYIRR